MANPGRGVLTSLVCLSALPLAGAALAQPDLAELVRQSTFVLQGTVTRLHAATMPVVPVSARTVVVRVDRIHQAPRFMARLAGTEVTLLVKDPAQLKVGDRAVFFAQGWLLGDGVALQEVGRLRGRGALALGKRLAGARQGAADQDLRERLASAELVVAGRVLAVRPRAQRDPGISEHTPNWQEALVEVTAVLKGDPPLKRVVVLFPESLDVAWVNVPRFRVRQEGIWILQRDPDVAGYTARDPLDFQPATQLSRVRRLLEGK